MRAEVRLARFDFAVIEWRLALAFLCNALPDFAKDHDDRALRKFRQLSHGAGRQVERKVAQEAAEFPLRDSRTPVVAV
jgi:hypothetical protein